ncbi:MAG: DUF2510 domain-containing protein [Coriobacteriales bacterium]|nr:DUF2510 domain-containing protein [Coriobacteriales bacterium]
MATEVIEGWYPDPTGDETKIRYWDGANWTDQIQDRPGFVSEFVPESLPAPELEALEPDKDRGQAESPASPANPAGVDAGSPQQNVQQFYGQAYQQPYGQAYQQPYGQSYQQTYQQPPYSQSYQQPVYYYQAPIYQNPPAVHKNDGAGIASLVLGICSVLFCLGLGLTIVPGIVGLVLGTISRNKRPTPVATAGIVLNIIAIALGVLIAIVFIVDINNYY